MSAALLFKKKDPENFWKHWEDLAARAGAGPRTTRRFVEWAFAIAQERGLEDDRSFILFRGERPVGAALMPIGQAAGTRAVTMGGGYVEAPLVVDPQFRKDVFDAIDAQALEVGARKAMYEADPLAQEPYAYLEAFGYLDTSLITYVIDLARPGDLLSQCRRNHARNLKEIMADARFTIVMIDKDHPDRAHHDGFERLHEKCSGRKTRSARTFDLQYEQLLAGEAVLFGLLFEGKPAAYGYFLHAHGKALYASVADDPDVQGFPLNHYLLFAGMEHYRKQGVTALVPGEPSSPSAQFDYWPDEKQRNIALFKTGFPGAYKPLYRGIRYYNRKAFQADASVFAERYASSLPS